MNRAAATVPKFNAGSEIMKNECSGEKPGPVAYPEEECQKEQQEDTTYDDACQR